jgi:hypothetical protein
MPSSFLAIFDAPIVLRLAGLSRIARHAGTPLIATLFATVGLLRVRRMRRAEADDKDDYQ